MWKRLFCLMSVVFVLGSALTSPAHADLVAWWRFDDGSGTTALDSSGNGNDAALQGGAQWVAGQLGEAIQFNGSNAFVRAPYIPLNSRSFTVAMWVNPVLYTGEQVVFSQRQTSATNTDLHFRLGGAGSGNVPAGGVRMGFYNNDLDTRGGIIQDNTWYHITFWYDVDSQGRRIYINGTQEAQGTATPYLGTSGNTVIGSWAGASQWYRGIIDDVQVYSHALTDAEIRSAMLGLEGYPYASSPSPADGALHPDTWVTLSWRAGDFAVSHDVYLGDNRDDVNNGTGDTFRGNQTSTYYVAGFPGFAYPDGLVPGTTYYWRIDEVNNADPNSPWKGPVWSFTVPPKKAYNPRPADGAKFIALDVTLSWTAGFGAKLHTVYFGENHDTVANATGGPPQALTTYKPAALKAGTTYYWRVDEFDGSATHKGDVWSFITAKEGGGIKGEYFNNIDLSGPPVLTRIDPQINFYWNPGPNPPPGVNEDNFSVRWTGELEAPFSEPFIFIIGCDDGARMYLNGELIINDWGAAGHDYLETRSQPIDLVAGEYYSIVVEGFELGGEAEWRLFWMSPSVPRDYVPQAALSPPIKASSPRPANGATGVSLTPVLTWNPGDFAASHEVYFGIEADAVRNATKASPEYKGSKSLGDESYSPGKLAWYTTYYWRVDEVNNVHPDSPWMGNLWSFTTGDFLLVDDFEGYDSGDNQIWFSWHDGLGYGVPGTPGFFAGNGTGSAVGDETTNSFTEETIVHGGRQSMPVAYDNNKQGAAKYSEVELKLTAPRNWTEEGVGELSIWFRGLPGSVGSFTEAPAGTYTMTASGTDIWNVGAAGNYHDEFHFAYKTLTGAGSITARVQSVQNTNAWSKAGVMIRETPDGGSKHAFACVTPSNGVASQGRALTGDASFNTNQTGVTAPHWVKLERDFAGNFTVSHSANGTTWQPVTGATPQNIQMASTVYIGLALTSHDAAQTCQAVFTNVTTTGTVSPQWAHQDIGIASNAAEPLYVAVSNAAGQPAVVVHPDPAAAQTTTWTEWVIPLQTLADQGVNLTNVDRIALGLGTRGNTTTPGGSGKMYFDDIRLYRPRTP